MSLVDKKSYFLMPLLVACLAAAIAAIFSIRFSTGDVYPPYSSLRSDPLGARGLYESLENLDNAAVSRNYLAPRRMKNPEKAVVFYAGVPSGGSLFFSKALVRDIMGLAASGNRVVIAFAVPQGAHDRQLEDRLEDELEDGEQSGDKAAPPENAETGDGKAEEASVKEDSPDQEPADPKTEGEKKTQLERLRKWLDIGEDLGAEKEWGLALDRDSRSYDLKQAVLAESMGQSGLPLSLDWRSPWFFKDVTPEWKTVYTVNGNPVLVERRVGPGSLVFASESYFLSNESLASAPQGSLLAWLVGPYTNTVFDEWRLGIRKQANVAALARKYGLTGVGAVLALWALLYIWHSALPLVPRTGPDRENGSVEFSSSLGHAEAMASLLQRHVPKSDLPRHCLALWERSAAQDSAAPKAARKKLREALLGLEAPGAKDQDIVRAFNEACRVLREDKNGH